jgi:hypothetical protein
MTEGRSKDVEMASTGWASSALSTVAFWLITSINARLNETIASGSYPALSTKVRTVGLSSWGLHGVQAACRMVARSEGARETHKGIVVTDNALAKTCA